DDDFESKLLTESEALQLHVFTLELRRLSFSGGVRVLRLQFRRQKFKSRSELVKR
ncbi:hypothetical protein Ccrd_022869, partial [Cynara cardunculus var. scolymus]